MQFTALIGQPKERAMKRQSRRTLCAASLIAAGLIAAALASGAFAKRLAPPPITRHRPPIGRALGNTAKRAPLPLSC